MTDSSKKPEMCMLVSQMLTDAQTGLMGENRYLLVGGIMTIMELLRHGNVPVEVSAQIRSEQARMTDILMQIGLIDLAVSFQEIMDDLLFESIDQSKQKA